MKQPKITLPALIDMKRRREKITALTCYDASMARLLNQVGVEVLLVGDSVGNVKLGYANTLPVTPEEMLIHTQAVRRGNRTSLLVTDMPFLSYEADPRDAVKYAGLMVKKGGAEAVKLEGGDDILPALAALRRAKIPVMGHLGLTPQSVLKLGGYRVQGRSARDGRSLFRQAKALEKAGVGAIVLEAVPRDLAKRITRALHIPTIGIGAGPHCDGQILVLDDMLGLTDGPRPRFVKAYASLRSAAFAAARRYREEVRHGRFPGPAQTYA